MALLKHANHEIMKLGVSTYSFWHFKGEKTSIEYVIEKAYELGLDGVEILQVQMQSEDNPYLQKLKRLAFSCGLDLCCLSIHQGFVSPDPNERQKNIDHTLRCIELAYKLGIPSIRLNSGRWGTIKDFSLLLANRGFEPPLEGYRDSEGFKWVIDSIEKCLPKAEECGVVLALENHWGLTRTAAGVLRIVKSINSEWLRALLDCGNFLDESEDIYHSIKQVSPFAVLVHAKTYFGGGEWYSLDIDYSKVAEILKAVNFRGYISIEFEGKENAETGVEKSARLLREVLIKTKAG